MYSRFYQTSQYIIPYHTVPSADNGQKDRVMSFWAQRRIRAWRVRFWAKRRMTA